MDYTGGVGCDLGIETAGSQITTTQLIKAAKKGSTIVLVGYSTSGEMSLPVGMLLDKELTIKTVFRYRNIYPIAIEAIASGKIDIKRIVSHFYEFDEIQEALDACIDNKEEVVKAIICVNTGK